MNDDADEACSEKTNAGMIVRKYGLLNFICGARGVFR